MTHRSRALLAMLGVALVASVADAGPLSALLRDAIAPRDSVKVLFIGNSLTYVHELPLVVEAVARESGGPPFLTRRVTRPGVSLGDLWLGTGAHAAIRQLRWDHVVMQQGPSAMPESRLLLRRDVALFAGAIRAAGAEPAVYQVWPERGRIEAFPDVLESYRLAAADVGATLLPVGSAWLAAWSLDPDMPLYGPDGLHPSPQAAYLAAIVIYEGLSGRAATGIPATLRLRNGKRLTVTEAQAATLQLAAEMVRAPSVD